MISKYSIWVVAGLFLACSSSGGESRSTSLKLEKSESGTYINDDVKSSVSSKRRGKLNRLQADGPAWFSFKVPNTFQKLNLQFSNGSSITWKVAGTENLEDDDSLPLNIKNSDSTETMIDVVITPPTVKIFFNEGEENFIFNASSFSVETKLEVYLDEEIYDTPGILYDLGD
ncbi:hypothetical protein SAMN05421640_3259 [Ekhidna lutea]|uniref:Uncharacterized protein n=1 Tax=Ekhidna lutea TaxID=447679 RepID=A0A239LH20_EKHLU|nr:hypothetical protein [Ekhidna lutea]SNT29590.1 hypothetical protein SAMN05421640_3259 [Ekhidna lutea]